MKNFFLIIGSIANLAGLIYCIYETEKIKKDLDKLARSMDEICDEVEEYVNSEMVNLVNEISEAVGENKKIVLDQKNGFF